MGFNFILGEDLRPMRMCFSEKEGQLHVLIKSYLPLPRYLTISIIYIYREREKYHTYVRYIHDKMIT